MPRPAFSQRWRTTSPPGRASSTASGCSPSCLAPPIGTARSGWPAPADGSTAARPRAASSGRWCGRTSRRAEWFRRAQTERAFVLGELGESPLSHMPGAALQPRRRSRALQASGRGFRRPRRGPAHGDDRLAGLPPRDEVRDPRPPREAGGARAGRCARRAPVGRTAAGEHRAPGTPGNRGSEGAGRRAHDLRLRARGRQRQGSPVHQRGTHLRERLRGPERRPATLPAARRPGPSGGARAQLRHDGAAAGTLELRGRGVRPALWRRRSHRPRSGAEGTR